MNDYPGYFILWVTHEDIGSHKGKADQGIQVLVRIGDARPMAFLNTDAQGVFNHFVALWKDFDSLDETFDQNLYKFGEDEVPANPNFFTAINTNIRILLTEHLQEFIRRPELNVLLPSIHTYDGEFAFNIQMFKAILEFSTTDYSIFDSLEFTENNKFAVENAENTDQLIMTPYEELEFKNSSNESAPDQLDVDNLSGELSQKSITFTQNDLPLGVTYERDWYYLAETHAPVSQIQTSSVSTQSSPSTTSQTTTKLTTKLSTIQESDYDEDIQIQPSLKATESTSSIVKGLGKDEPLEEFGGLMETANVHDFIIAFVLGLLNALSLNKVIATMVILQGALLNNIWNADTEEPFVEKLSPLYSQLSYTWTSDYAVTWFDEFGTFAYNATSGPELDGYLENIKPVILAEDYEPIANGYVSVATGMLRNNQIFGNKALRYAKVKPAPRTFMYVDFVNDRIFGPETAKLSTHASEYAAAFILEHLKESFYGCVSANNKVKAFWLQRNLRLKLTYQVRPIVSVELQTLGEVINTNINMGPSLISLNPHDHGINHYTFASDFIIGLGDSFKRTIVIKRILRELWMSPIRRNRSLKNKKIVRSWYSQENNEDEPLTI